MAIFRVPVDIGDSLNIDIETRREGARLIALFSNRIVSWSWGRFRLIRCIGTAAGKGIGQGIIARPRFAAGFRSDRRGTFVGISLVAALMRKTFCFWFSYRRAVRVFSVRHGINPHFNCIGGTRTSSGFGRGTSSGSRSGSGSSIGFGSVSGGGLGTSGGSFGISFLGPGTARSPFAMRTNVSARSFVPIGIAISGRAVL